MKKRLESFYLENLAQIREIRLRYKDCDLGGPLLISPSEGYITSKKKIFIVGQQTNGWCCDFDNVQNQMRCYEEFNLGKNYYRTPFWNVFRKIEKAILGEEYCSVWSNFNRYDFEGKRPDGEMEREISKLDYLLKKEIEILQPDICLFLVGHSFDERIKNLFPGIMFESLRGWEERQLARLKHVNLPVYTYRTYHPNYLRRSGLEERFINELKMEIS